MGPRRNNGTTVVLLLSVVAGMIGLSFASVPLYSLFCRATGWGGTTQRAAVAPKGVADAFVTIRFDAETAPDLGWEFRPLTRQIRVRPGEPHEVFYRATNRGSEPVTGTATYNVTPTKSGIYFDKLQCFCFTEQRLGPRREPRHGRAVLCRSRTGERSLDPRREHDHAVIHDVSQTRRYGVAGAAGPAPDRDPDNELSEMNDLGA